MDFYIEDETGKEHHDALYIQEFWKFCSKTMDSIILSYPKFQDLCVDYDRQASEFKRCVCEGEFPHFEVLFRSRMEELDRQMAKFEE